MAPRRRLAIAAELVIPAAFEPDAVAIAPDDSAEHCHAVHAAARHADAGVALGDRVAALDRHPAQVDPRPRRGRDQHAALGGIRDPVAARADPHVALDLGAGATEPETRGRASARLRRTCRRERREPGDEPAAPARTHGRTG